MSNTMESYLNDSGKLNGSNFTNWKFKIQTLLEGANAWAIVTGDEQKPTATTQKEDLEKRENKAKVLLKMSLKDNVIAHIRDCKTSAEIWTKIKNLYETQNTNRVLALKSKLFSMRMDEREFATAFVARIKDVKDGLGAIGVAVADEDLVAITMNGMHDDFQTFITGVSTREKAPAFDDLTAILQQEEDRRQNLNLNSQSDDLALVAKRRLSKGKQSQQQSKQRGGTSQKNLHSHKGMLANHYEKKCYYCGKTGNIQRDCYYKKEADEARRRQVNPKHRGYFVEEEDFSHEFRLFTVDCALSASNEDDIWYVDSGASSHMTVKLSNGKISHLSNVLYVPGIKKNLISVSMMADQDMHVESFKTHYAIKDCRNEIVATGMRVGSLYKLDAKSIPKQAMVVGESTTEQL
eukprot:PITA_25009